MSEQLQRVRAGATPPASAALLHGVGAVRAGAAMLAAGAVRASLEYGRAEATARAGRGRQGQAGPEED